MEKSIILNHQQIAQKTRRIAFQILESHSDVDEIILAGINGNGFIFTQEIKNILEQISDIKFTLCEVLLDKTKLLNTIETSVSKENYTNKHVILIDDVLSSGKTLIYGVKHFLNVPLASCKTAVLVNRNHKKFPIKADFKGLSLSTSLQETIKVDFSKDEHIAYLC